MQATRMSENIAATCRDLACDGNLVVPPPTEHNPKHDHAIIAVVAAIEPHHGRDHPARAAGESVGWRRARVASCGAR